MLNPINLILIGGAVLSAYALPTLPARSTSSRIVARQNALLTQPTTVNTSRSFTTSFGPMVEVCVVTLTPITAPNGQAAVEEVRACTVGIQPANNAGGGGAPSNPAPPPAPPADSAAPPAATDAAPPPPPADSTAPPAATDSGFAPAPTDSAALPAASNTDPFAPTPSDAAVSNIGAPGASSDGGAAPTPVSDGAAAPSDASGSAAPAPTDAAAASSGVPPVSINPVSTVNAADLPGFSAAPAASAVVSGSDAGASASPSATESAAAGAPSSTDASVSPVDAAATPSASAAAAEQSAPADDGTPGRTFSVLPIGLGVFAGISAIALIVVGLVTYERTKYRKAFRQRKLAEAGGAMAYGGMAQRT